MKLYSNYSDYELTILFKNGDQKAYTEIYKRYNRLLYHHAYRKTGDAAAAQDVLQDVFLSLWNKKSYLQEDANLSGYLYTALRNKILNLFAQKKVRDRYEESLQKFSQTNLVFTDHLVRERQLNALIAQEISLMPEKMQQIFRMSRQHHLKNKEIAELLGISEHTVATQLKRALKQLRIKLGLVLYIAFVLSSKFQDKENKIKKESLALYPKRLS